MQVYTCPIENRELSKTNKVWNLLQLNTPWSVGMVSSIIKQKQFDSPSDWCDYYLHSGLIRRDSMGQLSTDIVYMLNYTNLDFAQLYLTDVRVHHPLQQQYGRPPSLIAHRAFLLNRASGFRYSMNLAYDIVLYRVVGETWNGVIIREERVKQNLENQFSHIQIRHSSATEDYRYAIDFELYVEDRLLCALQIKPLSYDSNKAYVQKAKMANAKKYQLYKDKTGRPVVTLLADLKGHIKIDESFCMLKGIIQEAVV